jgi:hypothetical protein
MIASALRKKVQPLLNALLGAKSVFATTVRDNFRKTIKLTGREVDFTGRDWGHNLDKCGERFVSWCSPRLKDGDVIITERGRFIVYNVKPCCDPPDMAFFDCIKETDDVEDSSCPSPTKK